MAALPLGAAAGSALSATVIPAIAAPAVLLGAMAVLHATGFFINTLTLFILVLAIGLLVDDAIIVIENFWRLMRDEGLSPKDAAFKPMRQITGAPVGVAYACCSLGMMLSRLDGTGPGQEARSFDKGCRGGLSEECNMLGSACFNGQGVWQDCSAAAELYKKACKAQLARSCYSLAVMHQAGCGIKADPALSRKLMKRTCKLGHPQGCN